MKEYKGTKYEDIYTSFLRKITDYELMAELDEHIEEYMLGYLTSAIAKFPQCKELENRDDTLKRFECLLSPTVKEALAHLMIEEWVSPKVYNIINLKQFLGDSEYKYYSQANHLEKLKDLKDFSNNEAERLKIQYGNLVVSIEELR